MATGKLVALFPGQGSQHVGMAKELFETFKIAREAFEEASDAISVNLKKLCFDGPESDLVLTENTQPALLTASVATFRVAEKEMAFKPDAVAGHSLGEYSALVAARAFPLSTAVRWVKERGRAMQSAVPAGLGTMAAVMGLEDELVTKLCVEATASAAALRASGEAAEQAVEAVVEPANFNAPGQVVIAGSTDGVAEAIRLIKAGGAYAGGKAIPLQVSAPFHCKLMAPARARMEEIFSLATAAEKPKQPDFFYVPNRTARLTREPGVIAELLVDQVDHPVLWKQSMIGLYQNSFTTAVECGPGRVLTGLAKRIAQKAGIEPRLFSISDSATLTQVQKELQS